MEDRELLRVAATAAGLKLHEQYCAPHWDNIHEGGLVVFNDKGGDQVWNPLRDDGDALRLAVTLGLSIVTIGINGDGVCVYKPIVGHVEVNEAHGTDPLAATRRAIVRAAAALAYIGDLHDR